MTDSHLPPDAGGALPGPAAGQPVPAPSPGGLAPPGARPGDEPAGGPRGTSRVAIASVACAAGAVVLSAVVLAALFIPMWGATGPPPDLFFAEPVGIGACIAAVVLGVVALAQIRRTRQRGAGLAVAGMVLGCAMPVLWIIFIVVGLAIGCRPPHQCF